MKHEKTKKRGKIKRRELMIQPEKREKTTGRKAGKDKKKNPGARDKIEKILSGKR
ncbi:MAG: hypothetical protein HYR67_10955 [Bacteroidetes bacterium]|nr:hypothetical protein [Bacteroidota bacterium]